MTTAPDVRVLGPVRIRAADGGEAAPPGALPLRLVVALALAGRDGRSVAALAEDVWPEQQPRNPRAALQMLVSRTRAVAADGLIESTPAGYRIGPVDLEAAEHADEAAAAAALDAWRGEPGAELEPSPIQEELAGRAARARGRLLRLAADRLVREGRPADAVPLLEQRTAADPLDGAAARALMAALRDAGAVDRALAAFARHREALADALGADPAPETAALNTALLQRGEPGGPRLTGVRASATPLLGRDDDVAALTAAVAAHRLVSIVGTGGLGKTRLAHEVAARCAGAFDRVLFTELAGARADEDVALVVGAAAGARGAQARRLGDPAPADLLTRIREALGGARTLLVLDNCEHLVDAAARLAADLLASVPSLTVLTTSRVPLLLAGEHVAAPHPLPADGAGSTLFAERARAVRPGVALDPDVVARVCTRLDGLPLAIELAAARLRSMGLAELDRRLGDRFAVLVGGDRSAPERHRTLLAVIDWSRRLLSPAAEEALALLSAFPDGFTAAAADDLLDADASDVLTELVDQSLLTFQEDRGDGRYRMLETVREFGLRETAESGRSSAARTGLDRWALRTAARESPGLLLGRDPAATRAVAAEEETLLAVLRADPAGRRRVVVAVFGLLAEHWAYRGDFEATVEAVPALLAAARRPRSPEEREEALRALAFAVAVSLIGRGERAARALALLRRTVGGGAPTRSFWERLSVEVLLQPSLDAVLAGLERLSGDDDPAVRGFALMARAQLLENRGESTRALAMLAQVDAIAVRHGLQWLHVFGRLSAASLAAQRGEHRGALAAALALREEAVALDIGVDLQQIDWMIGTSRIALGLLDEAEPLFERLRAATELATGGDAADLHVVAACGLAEIATARGDAPAALAAWERVLTALRRASGPWRVLVLAASLPARLRLGAPPAALARDARRLRGRVRALHRLEPDWLDAPVLGSALVALSAVLRIDRPSLADELLGLGLAVGARRDLASLDLEARAGRAADLPPDEAVQRALEALRSPAARG